MTPGDALGKEYSFLETTPDHNDMANFGDVNFLFPNRVPTQQKLSREDINTFPLRSYDGPIRLVSEPEDVADACARLARERVIGFDTETRPAFRKGQSFLPSLLQLAGADCVYLFQLTQISLCDPLRALLADKTIVKSGVAVRDDIKGLQQHTFFEDAGFVDLSKVSAKHGFLTRGLRNMSANFLGFRIGKGAQRSNWGRASLTRKQQVYAATDAWVSRDLFFCFEKLDLL